MKKSNEEIREAFRFAVGEAIRAMRLKEFKKTSFFMSNRTEEGAR